MYSTSEKYKEMVYSREYARHFLPEIILKVIDTAARGKCSYAASSTAFCNNFEQLTDDNQNGTFNFGTLEDFQFLLDGTKRLMASKDLSGEQLGFCSEVMSNAAGNFDTPVELVCTYTTSVTTVGRTLVFDKNYDAVPKDFDLIYSSQGSVVKTVEVRGNAAPMVTNAEGVESYDKLTIKIYSMSRPYRRIHMPEDIPGIYFVYGREEVVSMNVNFSIDLFMRDIITGEVDFQIENSKKTLDILNPEGFEQYLRRRQPVEINLVMVFPDNSTETVPIGNLLLTDWKSQKGALTAQFTARDATDKLTQAEYVKGTIPATPATLREYAEAVFKDAGITDYTIDVQFNNIYTSAPLPIGTHKELLRLIAQAGQGIVLPTVGGGVHLKYVSPLLPATNVVKNAAFESDFTDWQQTSCTLDTSQVFYGKQSAKVAKGGTLQQTIPLTAGHKVYCRTYVWLAERLTSGTALFKLNGVAVTADLVSANIQPETWTMISNVLDATASNVMLFDNDAAAINVDGFMLIDLTATYGAGNEPDKKWCDQNIRFFSTTLTIPRVKGPTPVDTLDYSILIDAPEIAVSEACRSVETNIYSYVAEAEESNVYDGQRYIAGTEEFTIKFSKPAKECTLEVKSLDDSGIPTETNTATVVSSTIYAQAAVLKVTASSNVQIIVKGKAVNVESSTYKIDNVADVNLVPDAKEQTIDNRLVTNKTVAEDVAGYAAYWYNRRYEYNFDWRQNPAVQVLDTVTVYDDFNRNNGVTITEQNLDYTDGVLGGSSKGVY